MSQATQDATTRQLNDAYVDEASPEDLAVTEDGDVTVTRDSPAAPVDPTRNLLIYAGLAIAVISLAVLLVAWSARRYFADPLLR